VAARRHDCSDDERDHRNARAGNIRTMKHDRRSWECVFGCVGLSLLVADGSVTAADMPAKTPYIRSVFDWTGLYIGAHAGFIVGWPRATGEALLYELTQRADRPEFRLSHAWREGDVIVWDNRAVLHRATYYDAAKHKRFMQRTTIGGDLPTVAQ